MKKQKKKNSCFAYAREMPFIAITREQSIQQDEDCISKEELERCKYISDTFFKRK